MNVTFSYITRMLTNRFNNTLTCIFIITNEFLSEPWLNQDYKFIGGSQNDCWKHWLSIATNWGFLHQRKYKHLGGEDQRRLFPPQLFGECSGERGGIRKYHRVMYGSFIFIQLLSRSWDTDYFSSTMYIRKFLWCDESQQFYTLL